MYQDLITLFGDGRFYYGPFTREEAFAVPAHATAAPINGRWYVAVIEPVEGYEDKQVLP